MTFEVYILKKAKKKLDKFPDKERIKEKLKTLENFPDIKDVIKNEEEKIIIVVNVDVRGRIYKHI